MNSETHPLLTSALHCYTQAKGSYVLIILMFLTFDLGTALHAAEASGLDCERSILVEWPDNAPEEQIVVRSTSLEGPWIPCLGPIINQHGKPSCTVPITTHELVWLNPYEYFRVVPGKHFNDDFNLPREPFADRKAWTTLFWNQADAGRITVSTADGVMQISATATPADAFGRVVLQPPGQSLEVTDFNASLDIVDWDSNASDLTIGILARGYLDSPWPGDSNGYIGGVGFNESGNMGQARLLLYTGGSPDWDGPVFRFDSDASYRLLFSGVGSDLVVRLINLSNGEVIIRQRTATRFSDGSVGLWRQGPTVGSVTVDNFLMSGTEPTP